MLMFQICQKDTVGRVAADRRDATVALIRRRIPAAASAGAPAGADSGLNNRALALVGTEAMLVQAIGPGNGRVRLADSTWLAAGPDLPAGTRVRVVGARGAVLLVAPAGAHAVGE